MALLRRRNLQDDVCRTSLQGHPLSYTTRPRRRRVSWQLIAAACALTLGTLPAYAAHIDGPPTARTADVVEHIFGVTVHDPYRWMEGDHNAEFQQWLTAQGDDTRTKLDALPTLKTWQQTLLHIGN